MQNIRPFQIVLLAVFALLGIISVAVIASFEGSTSEEARQYGDRVLIWGTIDARAMRTTIDQIERDIDAFEVVEYTQKDSRTFEDELVNAIAEGQAPDVVLIPHESLVSLRSKLTPVPYDTFSQRSFRDRFIDGAEIFARSNGVYALPALVDPIVMYWNRDIFSANGLSTPPSSWEQIVGSIVPAITKYDNSGEITQSAVALGEYENVTNAKEMLLTLTMQSGSRMVTERRSGYQVALNESIADGGRPPLAAALQFYTNFSNPNNNLYSWNRGLADDRTAFLGGDLALYFGPGSASDRLQQQNPNLNFDVAPVPQGASATVKRVYGTFYGFAIVRATQNTQGSYAAIQQLVSDTALQTLAMELNMVPASRSLVAAGTDDPFDQVAYNSALVARGWLDPSADESGEIFAQMVDDVVSSRQSISDAVSDAVSRLTLAFNE